MGFLNSVSLLSALLLTVAVAIPLSVESDELYHANHRWSTNGEYGTAVNAHAVGLTGAELSLWLYIYHVHVLYTY